MASLGPNGGNKANWRNIWAQNIFFFKKILYVIPSALVSFHPYYCHSFRITVIPSELLLFLPDYCPSFRIIVLPSGLFIVIPYRMIVIPSQIIVLPSGLLSFLPNIVIPLNYCDSF